MKWLLRSAINHLSRCGSRIPVTVQPTTSPSTPYKITLFLLKNGTPFPPKFDTFCCSGPFTKVPVSHLQQKSEEFPLIMWALFLLPNTPLQDKKSPGQTSDSWLCPLPPSFWIYARRRRATESSVRLHVCQTLKQLSQSTADTRIQLSRMFSTDERQRQLVLTSWQAVHTGVAGRQPNLKFSRQFLAPYYSCVSIRKRNFWWKLFVIILNWKADI